jgi:hypothetical protein
VNRSWTFAALRAVTNALLRDLNTALVAEEMRRGTKAIYVDYVDYDEIAHHAGMFRPESLAALDGVDRVLAQLERIAEIAPRRYRIIALSDHGQSQGRPFKDRYEEDLPALVSRLMDEHVQAFDAAVEGWGRAEAIVGDVAGEKGLTKTVGAAAGNRIHKEYDDEVTAEHSTEPVVLGSGNLGLLYIPGDRRLSLDELRERWPALVDGLAEHPGVGFVAGLDAKGVPWALSDRGTHDLSTGEVVGADPLAPYGSHAPRVLLRALMMNEAPDLYLNSLLDADTNDIAAFEDLVGAHGGLGGYQDSAVLLAPADFAADFPDRIEGADELHRVLVGCLKAAGQRQNDPVA